MFDLNILCVGQKKPTLVIPDNQNIWINNANSNFRDRKKYYFEIAPLMNFIDGIWYELLCDKDEIGGTKICDYLNNDIGIYPYWISSSEIKGDLEILCIEKEYYESFKSILLYLIKQSPIERVIFFCSYQCNDQEVFCGSIQIDEFFELLKSHRILTNVCYSISK